MTNLINYRPAISDDFNFIISTWFKSQRSETKLDKQAYDKTQGARITKLLDESVTIVAVLSEDESVIIGYVTFNPDHSPVVVHYCYVKSAFRGHGIGTELLNISTNKAHFYYTAETKRTIKQGDRIYG